MLKQGRHYDSLEELRAAFEQSKQPEQTDRWDDKKEDDHHAKSISDGGPTAGSEARPAE